MFTRLIALAGACTLVLACGAPPATTAPATAAPPAPTTGGAATSAPVPTTSATGGAATSAPAPTTSAAVPTAVARPTQAAPTQAASDGVRLVLDPSASNASYHARETLVGKALPSDAVGTSSGVSGSLVLSSDGTVQSDQSTISVDLTKLTSDESRRDNFIKGNTLQTSTYPMATFVARSVQGLPSPLPRSGQATFQLLGDLTVHGVTKPATWQVTAQFADVTVSGNATTSVNLTDFGMTPPKVGPVLNIEDGLTLELAFTANRDA